MHRELTTAHSQADARELCRLGWRALRARDQSVIDGPSRKLRPNIFGDVKDDFRALMVRDVEENDTMSRRKADHHPHHAGVRHGGIAVGENAKRSGPQPGKTEFSPAELSAMQTSAAAPGPGTGGAPAGTPGLAGGGSPVPQDLDQDGGI